MFCISNGEVACFHESPVLLASSFISDELLAPFETELSSGFSFFASSFSTFSAWVSSSFGSLESVSAAPVPALFICVLSSALSTSMLSAASFPSGFCNSPSLLSSSSFCSGSSISSISTSPSLGSSSPERLGSGLSSITTSSFTTSSFSTSSPLSSPLSASD